MKVGIVGKPGSGKTSLFQALCRGQAQVSHSKEPVHGVVVVPDTRFDFLVNAYNPKKITPGTIDFVDDVARMGIDHGREFSDEAIGELRTTDAIVYVINGFGEGLYSEDKVRSECEHFYSEIALRDLLLLENRIERIEKQLKSPQSSASLGVEKVALEKVKKSLEDTGRFDASILVDNEVKAVTGFQLLTAKPVVIAVNVPEKDVTTTQTDLRDALEAIQSTGSSVFCLSAELERQVAELDEAEQGEFLAELCIGETVRDKLIRAIYTRCSLMTFFTVGEKEVHAWPLKTGSTALEAADSIHSDLARGFIRAEVISWEDIREAGSWDAAKSAGKLKLAGKEHIINDGDCLYIRFKV